LCPQKCREENTEIGNNILKEKRPFEKIALESVDAIELSKGEEKLSLKIQNNEWRVVVSNEFDFSADRTGDRAYLYITIDAAHCVVHRFLD